LIASDGLQIQLLVSHRGNIPDHIYNRWGSPAEIVQFIELDVQPIAVDISPSYFSDITGI
jgi:hypothetical protein